MPEPSVWIARIVFDPRVVAKLLDKHGVAPWEVEEACVMGGHREARGHTHPEFGRRLLVRGKTYRGDEILAYLVPIDERDGIWECLTMRRLDL